MKLASVIWENCQRTDGSYALQAVARQTGCKITPDMDMYLSLIETIRPVTSRQIAALSIATALAIYRSSGDERSAK
jgi:hypothetical protein